MYSDSTTINDNEPINTYDQRYFINLGPKYIPVIIITKKYGGIYTNYFNPYPD
jgi:hypothetical protein